MARRQPRRESEGRGGLVVLLVAWFLVLGLSAAAVGYFFLYPRGSGLRNSKPLVLAIPQPEEPSETAVQPADAPAEPQEAPAVALVGPPRIAVVVAGLGLAVEPTESAIERLPAEITLSFSPYATELDKWLLWARGKGHEVMLDLPMEPANFPVDDPGPQALLTELPAEENLKRLYGILDRGRDYVGVTAYMGSRFLDSAEALRPILSELKTRGILFLDNGPSEDSLAAQVAEQIALPHAVADRALDDQEPSREAINARVVQIERQALTNGRAVVLGHPYPATIARLSEWAAGLEARGFSLVPITALAVPAQ